MLKLIKTFVIFQRSKKGNYWMLIASILFAIIATMLSNIVGPYYYATFMDNIEKKVVSTELTWQNALAVGVITYFGIAFLSYVIQTISVFIITKLENKTIQRIDDFTAKHILNLSLDFFKDNFTGSLVSKQTAFSGLYEKLFDIIYWEAIPTIIVVVFSLPIIFSYSSLLGLVLFGYIILYCIGSIGFSSWMHKAQKRLASAKTKHTGLISDQIGNVQTVKLFGRDQQEIEKYSRENEIKTHLRITSWMRDFIYRQTTNTLRIVSDIVMIGICYYLWTKGDIHIGGIILAMSYNARISDRMWQLGNVIKSVRTIQADAAEMMEILEVKPTVVDESDTISCDIFAGEIDIDNISFGYRGTNTNVFTDFSLHIPAGQKVGIVGKSGSGKSTLVHLLMRMMDIQQGEIRIDGIPIHKVKQQELRQNMSIVPQDTTLFHRSVWDNIVYDKPDATKEEVILAAKKAQAHEFISCLSNGEYKGYDVKVGERGIKLSGGQRQRIGLARAFIRHKPLLILDEATSSLDSISERKIKQALDNLLHEQGTMIIIAHRLSTVQQLDRIIVMEQGEIIEDGTHEELYAIPDGTYRTLVHAQQLLVEGEKQSNTDSSFYWSFFIQKKSDIATALSNISITLRSLPEFFLPAVSSLFS